MKAGSKRFLVAMAASIGLVTIALSVAVLIIILPPWCGFARRHENLPAISVEGGNTVYGRMTYCDFRFPLPADGHVVRAGAITGDGGTIDGTIYVQGFQGRNVDMRAYADFLQRKHFIARPCDGSGCAQVTSRMSDDPFVSGHDVIHYPLFNEFGASSLDQEGGGLNVKIEAGLTKITFCYFGDL